MYTLFSLVRLLHGNNTKQMRNLNENALSQGSPTGTTAENRDIIVYCIFYSVSNTDASNVCAIKITYLLKNVEIK